MVSWRISVSSDRWSSMMPRIDAETPIWVSDKFSPSLEGEVQTDIVDSLSPPHTVEYISAQHALAQDCAALQLIDKDIEACQLRIAQAQTQIRLLERQRSAIEHRVSIHRARLSPLRTIPDQILQEIFQRCLPNTPYVVPSARSAPLVLTHVCRRWRAVAHGTSELWSSIALHDRGVWNYELELDMLKRWLSRAHTRPLSVRITSPPCTNFGGDPACSDVFQLALAHSTHLRDLCMHVSRPYLERFLSAARSLPALRTIALALHPGGDPAPAPVSVSAPRLRHMALRGTQRVPRALLAHLTHLALDGAPDPQLLRRCRRLAHLALALPAKDPGVPERSVVGTLRTLEVRLDAETLRFGDPGSLAALDALELPGLETLVVGVPRRSASADAWVHSPSVAGLLGRSRYARPRLERRVLGVPGRQGRGDEGFENWALF